MIWALYRRIVPDFVRRAVRFMLRPVKLCLKYPLVLCRATLGLPQKKPLKKIRFTIYLADHCNLNCVGCSNFSPIAEPGFLHPEELEPDIKRMGELFHNESMEILMSGGETLLNPQIVRIIEIVHENFPNDKIMLFTNGILLTSQEEVFWRTCHDSNVEINISHYPIKLDTDKIRDTAQKFGVTIKWAWTDDKEISNGTELKKFWKVPIYLTRKRNKNWNFANCYKGNWCIALHDGHLYSCSTAMCIQHFNKRFGFNISYPEDAIDIYKETDKDEILRKLAMPLEFCRHCELRHEDVVWHVSSGDIKEWVN